MTMKKETSGAVVVKRACLHCGRAFLNEIGADGRAVMFCKKSCHAAFGKGLSNKERKAKVAKSRATSPVVASDAPRWTSGPIDLTK